MVLWALGALLALLQGCAATGPSSTDWPWPDEPYAQSGGVVTQPAAEPDKQSPAAGQPALPVQLSARSQVGQSLLQEARGQKLNQQYSQAGATLERAIAIDAQDPVLWLELGQLRLEQGRLQDAETLAQRALEYLWPEDPAYPACWELIALARERGGDSTGASKAWQQARRRS